MKLKKITFKLIPFVVVFHATRAIANEPLCQEVWCKLAADGAYENFVLGQVVHIASDKELRVVFDAAKHHGFWKALPSDFSVYKNTVRLVSIRYAEKESPVSLFMMRDEYDAAPIQKGDFVRYRPHSLEWEKPKNAEQAQLFSYLTGCIAQLCSIEDPHCLKQYQPGIYTLDGKASNLNGKPLSGHKAIAPETFKPIN